VCRFFSVVPCIYYRQHDRRRSDGYASIITVDRFFCNCLFATLRRRRFFKLLSRYPTRDRVIVFSKCKAVRHFHNGWNINARCVAGFDKFDRVRSTKKRLFTTRDIVSELCRPELYAAIVYINNIGSRIGVIRMYVGYFFE